MFTRHPSSIIMCDSTTGGYCKFHKERLESQLDHFSALQSWAPELRNFQEYNQRPVEAHKCDRIIEKPTFIMKIDAGTIS